jgi:DNA-binding NarL/FixJ family response regulator
MKVLLVDDHPLVLSALQTVIESLGPDMRVVGAASAAEARDAFGGGAPFDLILLDLSLGDGDGFEVLAEMRRTHPEVPVVVVSASERASDVIRAIDLGAMGFVPKRSSEGGLREALRMVLAGGLYVPPSILGVNRDFMDINDFRMFGQAALPEQHQRVPRLDDLGLTPRQSEVLQLLLKGLPNKLIARELQLSVETVKDHVAAVLRALGVSSRTQAVLAVSQMMQARPSAVAAAAML